MLQKGKISHVFQLFVFIKYIFYKKKRKRKIGTNLFFLEKIHAYFLKRIIESQMAGESVPHQLMRDVSFSIKIRTISHFARRLSTAGKYKSGIYNLRICFFILPISFSKIVCRLHSPRVRSTPFQKYFSVISYSRNAREIRNFLSLR